MEQENLLFLQDALPFWNQLDVNQQSQLTSFVSLKRFQRGESLHNGDEECSGLYLVKSGQVRVYIISDTGKEITLYRLFERDICIFSASCVLKNINFTIYTQAEKETAAFLIPTSLFQQLTQNSIAIADYVNQLMASHFSDVMWIMEQVLFMSFDKRLANFLLEQANIEGADRLVITQEAIANHMGSAREVINRMLKYFQDEGMVELFRGGVLITNKKKLQSIA